MSGLSDDQKLALFDLLAEQRNRAWDRAAKLESRVAALEGHMARFFEVTATVLDNYSVVTTEMYPRGGGYEDTYYEPSEIIAKIQEALNA